jgi:hypothetical protein
MNIQQNSFENMIDFLLCHVGNGEGGRWKESGGKMKRRHTLSGVDGS